MSPITLQKPLFQSFFIGGFESSCHRLGSGKRLNMVAATRHDEFAEADYLSLRQHSIKTVRDGVCWPLIEQAPRRYDFSSAINLIRAARDANTQVIWDACHYGWPDDIDIFKPEFVRRFAAFARVFAHVLAEEGEEAPLITPINEISFFAWGGGDVGYLNPFAHGRGIELKAQLVRAAIEATEAIWDVTPHARTVSIDPVISVRANPERPEERWAAEGVNNSQYQAWDMLRGEAWPQLGGAEKYLDIIGVNYYNDNQWVHNGPRIQRGHPLYKPFSEIVADAYKRYNRPMFIAETGAEGEGRVDWLNYMAGEAREAISNGVPLEGLSLYPILDYPGWDDERYCPTGLLTYVRDHGQRDIVHDYADEIRQQQELFDQLKQPELAGAA